MQFKLPVFSSGTTISGGCIWYTIKNIHDTIIVSTHKYKGRETKYMKKLFLIALTLIIMTSLSLSCFQIVIPDNSSGTSKPTGIVPVAYIDSINPTTTVQGNPVVFNGHGTDSDGNVIGYEWRSNLDGIISTAPGFTSTTLSPGSHTINFRVIDNSNQWSSTVTAYVIVNTKTAGPTIEKFVIVPDSVTAGNPVELQWSVSGATSISIDNGVGKVSPSGSMKIYPIATQMFTLTAINSLGVATKTVTVSVQQSSGIGNPTVEFTAQYIGGITWRLNWVVQNATHIVIEPEIGTVNPTGSRDVQVPSGQSKRYQLTATNPGGWFSTWQVTLVSP
jgi:hypothetical protein